LPCGIKARQRIQNTRQSLCRASTHDNERTATYCPATDSLPRVVPETDSKASAVGRNRCRAPWDLCRALERCRASSSLPCVQTLPCVDLVAVRTDAAVRQDLCRAKSFAVGTSLPWAVALLVAVRPAGRPHGKARDRHTQPAVRRTGDRHVGSLSCVCARQSDQMVLCRVHTHGKEPPVFQIFSVFLLIPAF
jgi:hypothetical protein